ncbi:MAG: lipoyl(octanoyl) transferase LipB [Caldisericia bacterium]|nr:lipoyl(octanoyl) transferase LipB [Caldisericia bacterium]
MIIVSFPLLPYKPALELQERVHALKQQNKLEDTLLLLEHPPTITIGKNGDIQNVLFSRQMLQKQGVEIFQIGRGGDVTYHGPGQLVGYPIFDIRRYAKGIKEFIYKIEEIFLRLLHDDYHIEARHDDQYTGVWVGNQKVTAIGFQISHFISMHGFALNVNTNLNHFKWINPCGITDKGVTSLRQLTGKEQSRGKVEQSLIRIIESLFCQNCHILTPDEFEQYLQQKEAVE